MAQHHAHDHGTTKHESIKISVSAVDSPEERKELMSRCLEMSGEEVDDSMLDIAANSECLIIQVAKDAPKHNRHERDRAFEISAGLAVAHDGLIMELTARRDEKEVIEWDGPVPEGSYRRNCNDKLVSTPEFLFLRRANELTLPEAVLVGNELCGFFISAGVPACELPKPADNYFVLFDFRTYKGKLRAYLDTIKDTPEGKRALEVLDYVAEGCANPLVSWLSFILTLPAAYGGYGLTQPRHSTYVVAGTEHYPSAEGAYLSYDLLWDEAKVACTYTGPNKIDKVDLRALKDGGTRVVRVRDQDLTDFDRLEAKAQKIAKLLGEDLPEKTDEWTKAHASLLDTFKAPIVGHMRSTAADLMFHYF